MIIQKSAEAIARYVASQDTGDLRRQFVVYGLPTPMLAGVQAELVQDERLRGFALYRVTTSDDKGGINWDALVHHRDTVPLFVALAAPETLDSIHYSIRNATTPVGVLDIGGELEETLERLVLQVAAGQHGLNPAESTQQFEAWLRRIADLGSLEQRRLLWQALGRLVEAPVAGQEAVHYALGLPHSDSPSVEEACDVLDALREVMADESTTGALQRLREEQPALAPALERLEERLMTPAAAMSNDPVGQAFAVEPADLPWWRSLPTKELSQALRPKKDDVELKLEPLHPVNTLGCLPDHWYVVRSPPVRMAVSSNSPEPVHDLVITHGKREVAVRATLDQREEFEWGGSASVARLDARAKGASGWVKILVLDQHPARCLAVVSGATCKPPRKDRGKTFSQLLELSATGDYDLVLLCASGAESVHIEGRGFRETETVLVTDGKARIPLKVEGAESYDLRINLPGAAIRLKLSIEIDFPDDEAAERSRLQALLRAHAAKGRLPRVVPPRQPSSQLEDRILANRDSWRPQVIALPPDSPLPEEVNWQDGVIGEMPLQRDPRPQNVCLQAPARFLEVRTRLQEAILGDGGFALADPKALVQDVKSLLEAYEEWYRNSPADASWCDVMSVMEPGLNAQAATWTASGEPVAVLLSPLHPVRLAWWTATSVLLEETLPQPCPLLAGCEPHACLDALALHIHDIQPGSSRTFVSVPTSNPGWSLLWHAGRLRDMSQSNAMGLLNSWGLGAPGLSEGMNSGQAQRVLDDALRLLPAHATLRLGVVGASSSGASTSQGIMEWIHARYEGPSPTAPERLEVLDARAPEAQPFPRDVAHAFEASGGKATWHTRGARMRADVVLVDHLDLREPQGVSFKAGRTASARGLLARFRIRLDEADASTLLESRVGGEPRTGDSLDVLLERVVAQMEAECAKTASHIQFEPNLTGLQSWLEEPTHYIAVSSSELDAACFARGTQARGGYLWEYTLPELLVSGPRAPGYFLIARKSEPLREAVDIPLANLGCPPEASEAILDEISRRGIPLLKRLAAGGPSSKGELGAFLTARFLQDAFRLGRKPRLPVWDGETVTLLVPVDPYTGIFDSLRHSLKPGTAARRGDLIVLRIRVEEPVRVNIAVVESKWREEGAGQQTLRDASSQAKDFAALLAALWATPHQLPGWDLGTRIFLAHIADQAMRIYGDPNVTGLSSADWSSVVHERVLNTILREAPVSVLDAGFVVAAGGDEPSKSFDFDGDGVHEALLVSRTDARSLVVGDGGVDPEIEAAFRQWGLLSISTGAVPPHPLPPAAQAAPATEPAPSGPTTQAEEALDERLAWAINRVAEAFRGFIGNEPAVANISRDLKKALLEPYPELAKNFLLTGNPSTGKTEIAKRLAAALSLPFIHVDGTSIESRDALFDLVDAKLAESGEQVAETGQDMGRPRLEYPAFVVLIDEVHLCRRPVQEALLTLLQEHRAVLSHAVIHAPRATFVLATTRPTDVDGALRSRCMEVRLRPYTEEEVAQMLGFSHPELEESVRREVAALARCVPRVARSIATDVITESRVSPTRKPWRDHLDAVRRSRGMDIDGITEDDLAYLRVLERAGGPIGEKSIVAALASPDYDHIRFDIEPFLQARRLVELTPRGRIITALGRDRLREEVKSRNAGENRAE